ncbi:MAG TPA: hypothetical protein DCE71_06020 [Parachlamydiales bacterium]|nr:hypothetical protein [Parachlamydiales bacterium]
MNYLKSGLYSVGNLFVKGCNTILPGLTYSALSIGYQDARIRILMESALLMAAGIDMMQISGISKTTSSYIWECGADLCEDLLPETVSSVVNIVFEDERIRSIIGGFAITIAGLNVIQASRKLSSKLNQAQEGVVTRAFRLSGTAAGVTGCCIGISIITLGTLRLLLQDESAPQLVAYDNEESDLNHLESNLNSDQSVETDCMPPFTHSNNSDLLATAISADPSEEPFPPDVMITNVLKETDCIYPDYFPGCKPDCIQGSLQIKRNYPCMPGYHSTLSPITGSRAHEIDRLRQYPDEKFRLALEEMANRMHKSSSKVRDIIHEGDLKEAMIIADEMYSRYIDRYRPYGIHEENAVQHISYEECSKNKIRSKVRRTGADRQNWTQIVTVCEKIHHKEFVVPRGVIAIHELGHVEEKKAGSTEKGSELFTILRDMINLHRIRSQIYGLDPDVEVDYGKNISVIPRRSFGCHPSKVKQPLGKFIAFYSKLSRTKLDLADTVFSPESIEFLTSCEK